MDNYSHLLHAARHAHATRTGHTKIFIGMNFVECLQCHAHAHIHDARNALMLTLHDRGFTQVKPIDATEF